MANTNNPAHHLSGLTLRNGWKVLDKIDNDDTQTGGKYSVCYNVERDGARFFLKAFDLLAYIKGDGDSDEEIKQLRNMLNQYDYESEISNYCQSNHLDKIVTVIDHDILKGEDNSNIPYLIFDRADCDVRKLFSYNTSIDIAWKLKSLHEIATGLKQLHNVRIYHQDIKPSNILTFNEDSKISDLGRSIWHGHDCPFVQSSRYGDHAYVAPEIAYKYQFDRTNKDEFITMMMLTDLYLFGSLICYYFTNLSYNGLLYSHIPNEMHYLTSSYTYGEMLNTLVEAHAETIVELRSNINITSTEVKEEIIAILDQLCNPDFSKRKHPRVSDKAVISKKFGMERIVTIMNRLHRTLLLSLAK